MLMMNSIIDINTIIIIITAVIINKDFQTGMLEFWILAIMFCEWLLQSKHIFYHLKQVYIFFSMLVSTTWVSVSEKGF